MREKDSQPTFRDLVGSEVVRGRGRQCSRYPAQGNLKRADRWRAGRGLTGAWRSGGRGTTHGSPESIYSLCRRHQSLVRACWPSPQQCPRQQGTLGAEGIIWLGERPILKALRQFQVRLQIGTSPVGIWQGSSVTALAK